MVLRRKNILIWMLGTAMLFIQLNATLIFYFGQNNLFRRSVVCENIHVVKNSAENPLSHNLFLEETQENKQDEEKSGKVFYSAFPGFINIIYSFFSCPLNTSHSLSHTLAIHLLNRVLRI